MKFLVGEKCKLYKIYRRMCNVYEEASFSWLVGFLSHINLEACFSKKTEMFTNRLNMCLPE